jgi:hypothetical protein
MFGELFSVLFVFEIHVGFIILIYQSFVSYTDIAAKPLFKLLRDLRLHVRIQSRSKFPNKTNYRPVK